MATQNLERLKLSNDFYQICINNGVSCSGSDRDLFVEKILNILGLQPNQSISIEDQKKIKDALNKIEAAFEEGDKVYRSTHNKEKEELEGLIAGLIGLGIGVGTTAGAIKINSAFGPDFAIGFIIPLGIFTAIGLGILFSNKVQDDHNSNYKNYLTTQAINKLSEGQQQEVDTTYTINS